MVCVFIFLGIFGTHEGVHGDRWRRVLTWVCSCPTVGGVAQSGVDFESGEKRASDPSFVAAIEYNISKPGVKRRA